MRWVWQLWLHKPPAHYNPPPPRFWDAKEFRIQRSLGQFVTEFFQQAGETAIGTVAGDCDNTRHVLDDDVAGEKFADQPSEMGQKCFVTNINLTPLLAERLARSAPGEDE